MAYTTLQSLLDSMIANNAQQNYSGGSQQQYMYVPGQNGSVGGLTLTQGFNPNTPLWNGRNQADQIQPQITRENAPMRQMTDTERLFATLGSAGDNIASYWDFGGGQAQSLGDLTDPAKLAAFAANLPMGIIAAPFSAAQSLYEAATGTPISTSNLDTNEVSTYQYNANEKAAAGVTGAIDALGTLAGGTGRLVGAGAGLVGKALGKAESPVLKGFAKTTAGQLGFDALEEGSEEFVQSVADDVKMGQFNDDSWGRALNAASLGAVGGVAMSGAAHGINRAVFGPQNQQQEDLKENYSANQTEGNLPAQAPSTRNYESDLNAVQTAWGKTGIDAVAKYEAEKMADERNYAGSMQMLNVVVDDFEPKVVKGTRRDENGNVVDSTGLGLNEFQVGVDDIMSAYNGNHKDSRATVAEAFSSGINGHDAKWAMGQLDTANAMYNWKDRAAVVNDMLKTLEQDGYYVNFAIGRNPHTNPAGSAKGVLVGVSTKRNAGIGMSRLAYTMFGSDVDGDITQGFFSKELPNARYLTERLVNPVSGQPNYSKDYWDFADNAGWTDPTTLQELEGTLNHLMADLKAKNADEQWIKNQASFIKKFIDFHRGSKDKDVTLAYHNVSYTLSNGKDDSGAAAAQVFSMLGEIMKAHHKATVANSTDASASEYANDELQYLVQKYDRKHQIAENYFKDLQEKQGSKISNVYTGASNLMEASEREQLFGPIGTPGDVPLNMGRVVTLFRQLGFSIEMLTNHGNTFFRQVMAMYLASKPTSMVQIQEELGFEGNADTFKKLMAWSFRLTDVSEHVEEAIEGAFRVMVMQSTDEAYAASKEKGCDTYKACFIKAYDEMAKAYNDAVDTSDFYTYGLESGKDAFHKKQLSSSNDSFIAQEFLKIYEFRQVKGILEYIPPTDTFVGDFTFGQLAEKVHNGKTATKDQFYFDEEFNKFWKEIVKQYGKNEVNIGRRVIDVTTDLAKMFKETPIYSYVSEVKNKDGEIVGYELKDPKYSLLINDAINTVANLVDPAVMSDLGLRTIEGFMATRWGREIMSGDAARAKNAIVSLQLLSQYNEIIQLEKKYKETKNPAYLEKMQEISAMMGGDSYIHIAISESIAMGDTSILRSLTSLDITYDKKLELFGAIRDEVGEDEALFMADVCHHGSDSLSLSAVSNRLKRTERLIQSFMDTNEKFLETQWSEIKSSIKPSGQKGKQAVFQAFMRGASDMQVSLNLEFAANMIYSAGDVVKKQVEKGISVDSATFMENMLSEALMGGHLSYIDNISSALGCMTAEFFTQSRPAICRLLTDPKYSIRLHSPNRSGSLTITQAAFYKEMTGDDLKNPDQGMDENEFFKLIDAFPRLLSIITPQTVSSSLTQDNEQTTKSGMAVTPKEWVEQNLSGDADAGINRNRTEVRNFVIQNAFDDPTFWELVTYIAGDEIVKAKSIKECERHIMKAIDTYVDNAAYYLSLNDAGHEMEVFRANQQRAAYLGAIRNAYDMQLTFSALHSLDDISYSIASSSENLSLSGVLTALDQALVFEILDNHKIGKKNQKLGELVRKKITSNINDQKKAEHIRKQLVPIENSLTISTLVWEMMSDEQRESAYSSESVIANRRQIASIVEEVMKDAGADPTDINSIISEVDKPPTEVMEFNDLNIRKIQRRKSSAIGKVTGNSYDSDILFSDVFDKENDPQKVIAILENIYKKYGQAGIFNDEFTKEIEDEWNGEDAAQYRMSVRRLANNVILQDLIAKSSLGSGADPAVSSVFHQLDCEEKLFKQFENLRKRLGEYNLSMKEQNRPQLSLGFATDRLQPQPIRFDTNNNGLIAMATGVKIAANSATVSTGIGMNGGTIYDLAGFSILSRDFMKTPSASPSGSTGSMPANIIYEILAWSQEAQFLKFKKSTNMVDAIVKRAIAANGIGKVFNNITGYDAIKEKLDAERVLVSDYYKASFDKEKNLDVALNRESCNILSAITTPYIEVSWTDQDGEHHAVISSKFLENEDAFDNHPIGKIIKSIPVSIRIPTVSLTEVSHKILREVNAELLEKGSIDNNRAREIADNAALDWDSYSEPGFSISDVAYMIQPRSNGVRYAARTDFVPTAMQSFIGEIEQSRGFKRILGWNEWGCNKKPSIHFATKEQQDGITNRSNEVKTFVSNGKKSLDNYCFSSFKSLDETPRGFERMFSGLSTLNQESKNLAFRDGTKLVDIIVADPGTANIVQQLKKEVSESYSNGHAVAMPFDLFSSIAHLLPPSVVMDTETFEVKPRSTLARETDAQKFVVFDIGNFDRNVDNIVPTAPRMQIQQILPKDITTALAHYGSGITDAACMVAQGAERFFRISGSFNLAKNEVIQGDGIPSIVDDVDELDRIMASIEGDGNLMIDESAYDSSSKKMHKTAYIERIKRYVNFVKSGDGRVPLTLSNVSQGDCIGFFKRSGSYGDVYVPIFFEASPAPREANTVSVEFDADNSELVVNYAKDGINSNDSAYKMQLYNMPFKGIVTVASDKMTKDGFPAINHCGMPGFHSVDTEDGPMMTSHILYDGAAMSGRAYGFDHKRSFENMYIGSLMWGGNLFYETNEHGELVLDSNKKPKPKNGLNPTIDPKVMVDILDGNGRAWKNFLSGDLILFSDPEFNEFIKKISSEIYKRGGQPHLFFCPTRVTNKGGVLKSSKNHYIYQGVLQAFYNFNQNDMLKVFHAINGKICPPDNMTADTDQYVLDANGNLGVWVKKPDGSFEIERRQTVIGFNQYMDINTETGMQNGVAGFGFQRVIADGLQNGLFPRFTEDMIRYATLKTTRNITKMLDADTDRIVDSINRRMEERGGKRLSSAVNQDIREKVKDVLASKYKSSLGSKRREELSKIIEENEHTSLTVEMTDGKHTNAFDDDEGKKIIASKIDDLNTALGITDANKFRFNDVMQMVCYAIGYSKNRGEIQSITINQFVNAVNHMINNINNGTDFIIDGKRFSGYEGGERVRIPLLPATLMRRIWETPKFRARYDNFKMFQDHCLSMAKATVEEVKALEDPAKRQAIWNILDAVAMDNGYGEISGWGNGVSLNEMVLVAEKFGGMIQGWGFDFVDSYREMQRLQSENARHITEYNNSRRAAVYNPEESGSIVTYGGSKHDTTLKVLNTLIDMRKMMGMTYIGLLPGNLMERKVHQGQISAALKLGRMGLGAYSMNSEHEIDRSVVDAVSRNPEFQKFFIALREAERLSIDSDLLLNIRNSKDINDAIQKTFKDMSRIERISNTVVDIANGKNTFIRSEIVNFLDAFAMYADQEGHEWWFRKEPGEAQMLDKALRDPIKWFTDCYSIGVDNSASPDFGIIRKAINFAKAGDMAQKNVVSAIYSEIAKYHTNINFLVCTLISPYVQYGTNRLGRITNLLAPISSLHYLVTKSAMSGVLGEIVIGKNVVI
jgi:hypothetical protein